VLRIAPSGLMRLDEGVRAFLERQGHRRYGGP
jgi:hypothetical protein